MGSQINDLIILALKDGKVVTAHNISENFKLDNEATMKVIYGIYDSDKYQLLYLNLKSDPISYKVNFRVSSEQSDTLFGIVAKGIDFNDSKCYVNISIYRSTTQEVENIIVDNAKPVHSSKKPEQKSILSFFSKK